MKDTIQHNTSLSLTNLFESVAYNIESLENSIKNWPPRDDEYVPEYVLQEILSGLGRCKDGLSLLEKQQLTADQHESSQKLHRRYSKNQKLIETLLENDFSQIVELFSRQHGLGLRLNALTQLLEKIKRRIEIDFVFENREENKEDIEDYGEELLRDFTDFARIIINPPPLIVEHKHFIEWKADFEILDKKIKDSFSYFSPLINLLEKLKVVEYDPKQFWWLQITPPATPEFKTCLTEEQIPQLYHLSIPHRDKETSGAECPDPEIIIAFANRDQIRRDMEQLAEKHVQQCEKCLDLLLGIRAANAAVKREKRWKEALTRIPAWRLYHEHGDQLLKKAQVKTEFPDCIPDIRIPKGFPHYTAMAQAIRPSASSLVMYQDTGSQEQLAFAKLITIRDEEILSLEFLIVSLENVIVQGKKLHITGQIEDFNPEHEEFQWLCDWLTSDGHIIEPAEFKVYDSGFSVYFNLPTKRQPKGELRLLLLRKQPSEDDNDKT
jgi:hypothetical protein